LQVPCTGPCVATGVAGPLRLGGGHPRVSLWNAAPGLQISAPPRAARAPGRRLRHDRRGHPRSARARRDGRGLRAPDGAREGRGRAVGRGRRARRPGPGRGYRGGAGRRGVRQACRRGRRRRHAAAPVRPHPRGAHGGQPGFGRPRGAAAVALAGHLRGARRRPGRRLRGRRRAHGPRRRLRHPGRRRALRHPPGRQLLRGDGPAAARHHAAAARVRPADALPARGDGLMSEEILVNVTPRETRVAVVENGMLQELHIERGWRRGVVGNIYKGKVQRVMPGMQAAFVDIGLERTAFLHANDVVRPSQPEVEDEALPPVAVPVRPVTELLRDGQEVIVQVVKDPIGSQGARLTTQLSIPSRYLVLLPQSRLVGVSARIEDEAERARLKALVAELSPADAGLGYIVRTNAEGQPSEALAEDLAYLSRVWNIVDKRSREAPVQTCIYEDLSLPLRAVRDLIRKDVEKVKVDSRETYERLQAFVAKYMPVLAERIELYTGNRPIFDLYGVEDEIQRALDKEVPLKSGGYLVIDQTEAMTTVDVNTGSFVGQRNLEETVYRTNLEAAQAVARQLRLRNLGGIIIIDFIDMVDEEHR